jgi:2-polyprenyl-3-methyl-5-hydroxy-6-metoxy-1,4-benzoquinol methylase
MPPQEQSYEPRTFWIQRHEELAGDIRSVGNRGRSIEENEAGYKKRGQLLRDFISKHVADPFGKTVLEFGCGIGKIAEELVPLGLEYAGIDISERALKDAKKRRPDGDFILADITTYKADKQFDIVLTSAVLCHMVDPLHWRAVLTNMADALRPDGALILAEDLYPEEAHKYSNYVLCRTIKETEDVLRELGLELQRQHSLRQVHIARRSPRPR